MIYPKYEKMAEIREERCMLGTSLCKQSYAQKIHIVWEVGMCIKMWIMWITLGNSENTRNLM